LKTFLSKSENTWLQKPNIVSRGAQYSFKEFADKVTDDLEKDNLAITEKYFIEIVFFWLMLNKPVHLNIHL
jgi:magnesium-transporting ATPase (P-type)